MSLVPFINLPQHKRSISIFFGILFQILVVPNGLFTIYAMLTVNLHILIPLILICILQYNVKKSQSFVKFVNKYIKPTRYVKTFERKMQEVNRKQKKCMFCFHPHGIFSYSILLNMNFQTNQMPAFTALGSRFGLNAPFLGLILRLWGCSSVNKQNMRYLMRKGQNIGLVPGGYEQASITSMKQFRLFLKNRKGFIKYALQNDYTIYPVLTFGEQTAYNTFDRWTSLKFFFNKLKIPATIFWSKYLFFLNPNIMLTAIVGKGLKKTNYHKGFVPSIKDVEKYHALYVKQVQNLYQKYKYLNQNQKIVFY